MNEEMEKVGVECKNHHDDLMKEMEKTGSDSQVCPHCGKTLKKESK